MQKKQFANRKEWRHWLEKNHNKETEVWLVFYKVNVDKVSLKHEDALEEALCFGWIDSKLRRIDDEKHMQRFTPRKPKSIWAASNKARVKKLINEGLMTEAGLNSIKVAKENGSWNQLDNIEPNLAIPEVLQTAFKTNKKVGDLFEKLPLSRQKQLVYWIETAKRPETKEKRVKETLLLIANEARQ